MANRVKQHFINFLQLTEVGVLGENGVIVQCHVEEGQGTDHVTVTTKNLHIMVYLVLGMGLILLHVVKINV